MVADQKSLSCSWCHTVNPAADRFCRRCGHEAHVARMACRCAKCLLPFRNEDAARCGSLEQPAAAPETPSDLAELEYLKGELAGFCAMWRHHDGSGGEVRLQVVRPLRAWQAIYRAVLHVEYTAQIAALAARGIKALNLSFTCGYCGQTTSGPCEAGPDGDTWYHPHCWQIVNREGEGQ